MSSKGVTEKQPGPESPDDWQAVRERAPSFMREDEPQMARFFGMIGLLLLTLGAVALVVAAYGRVSRVGPGMGMFCVVFGLGFMLLHAARDKELQVRRLYGLFGVLWLVTAGIVSAIPIKGIGAAGVLFLPYGFVSLSLGLLFLLAFVHNETEEQLRERATGLLGVVAAGLAITAFVGGNISPDFLLPYGVLLGVLGLAFGWAYVSLRGTVTDQGHRAGLALGALGLLAFVVALARSIAPMVSTRLDPYLVPNGLLLMGLGLVYAVASAGLVSDNLIITMTRRELSTFFFSPIAYFVLFVATGLAWLAYFMFLNFLFRSLEPGSQPPVEPVIQFYIIHWWPIITILMAVPLLTMGLLSEERRTGTMEVLLTAPVDELPIVLSKFLAALIFFLVVCLPWGLFLLGLRIQGDTPFDYRPLLSFLVAVLATGAAQLSMGLFFSSLTRYQIAAFILTFVGMFAWMLMFFLQEGLAADNPWRTIMAYVSFVDLWMEAVKGTLSPRHLIIHISAAVFWLFLTVKVLEVRKWS